MVMYYFLPLFAVMLYIYVIIVFNIVFSVYLQLFIWNLVLIRVILLYYASLYHVNFMKTPNYVQFTL